MRLSINTYTGEIFTVDVHDSSASILQVKEKIADTKQCDVGDLRLTFSNSRVEQDVDAHSEELFNSDVLQSKGIEDGDTLDLMVVPGMKFCKECNNMLYPRENRAEKKLYFFCRNCKREEKTDMHCTYRNEVRGSSASERNLRVADIVKDPCLGHLRSNCPVCGHDDVVYYQICSTTDDRAMVLWFACCNKTCHHKWQIEEDIS